MPRKGKKNKSEYGMRLAEKQKLRSTYGLRERQFRSYFRDAHSAQEVFERLETRLDSVVWRMGLTLTRGAARQMVGHGHILVNGKRVNIPSFRVRSKDILGIRPQSTPKHIFTNIDERLKKYEGPSWVRFDQAKHEGTLVGTPSLEEAGADINLQTVMEFYSR